MEIIDGLDKIKRNSQEIQEWIEKLKKENDITEEYFENQRKEWNDKLYPIYKQLNNDVNNLIEISSYVLSYRHTLSDEINLFLNRITKLNTKYKNSKADRFIFYSTGFSVKLSGIGEKTILFNSELAEVGRNIELHQSHVEFLRECKDNCDKVGYTIKNKISLLEYLGN